MDIYLVRHAQPAWIDEQGGVMDPGLTELGQRQAKAAAEAVADLEALTDLWISPTLRTVQTAAPIQAAIGLTPTVVEDLREIRPPDWTGHPQEEIAAVFRQAIRRPPEQWWDGLPGGEDCRSFSRRVRAALLEQLASIGARPREGSALWDVEAADRRVIIVGHGGTNAVLVDALLRIAEVPWPWDRFVHHHAAITHLRTSTVGDGFIFGLRGLNLQAHIPAEDRTR